MDSIRPDFTFLSLAIVKYCRGFLFVLDLKLLSSDYCGNYYAHSNYLTRPAITHYGKTQTLPRNVGMEFLLGGGFARKTGGDAAFF